MAIGIRIRALRGIGGNDRGAHSDLYSIRSGIPIVE